MKVLHVCLGCFYIDKYSYQENLLPKYHKKLGYDVEILASLDTFDENGKLAYLKNESIYYNENEILVKRVSYKSGFLSKINKKMKRFNGVYNLIEEANPDVIFIHGCQFVDIKYIAKYVKNNSSVKVYVDNHADFSNSATNWFSKNILHKIIWKSCAQIIEPYTSKFYGVLPARVDFLTDVYKLPKEKVELLVMGADDEKVIENKNEELIKEKRKKYSIADDEFLIVTGGKIDSFKKQTLLLMEAIKQLNNSKIKLIVFGSVTKELKEQVESYNDGEKIQFIGWLNSEESYIYFEIADLVIFPGRHSVFWEQVAGQGKPMVVKFWEGTTHIDLGGNVRYLYNDSVVEIKDTIQEIYFDDKAYMNMMSMAAQKGMENFSYREIAARSI